MAELAADGPSYLHTTRADGTRILPALRKAAEAIGEGTPSSVIVVTDTQVSDPSPSAVQAITSEMNVTSMSVIIPTKEKVQQRWDEAFAWEAVFKAHPSDSDEIAVAVGKAVAHATGQSLERTERSNG